MLQRCWTKPLSKLATFTVRKFCVEATLQLPPGEIPEKDDMRTITNTRTYYMDKIEKYGPIFKDKLYGMPCVHVTEPEDLKWAFSQEAEGSLDLVLSEIFYDVFGEQIKANSTVSHKTFRKNSMKNLTNATISERLALLNNVALDHVNKLYEFSNDNNYLNIYSNMLLYTLDISTRINMGLNSFNISQIEEMLPHLITLNQVFSIRSYDNPLYQKCKESVSYFDDKLRPFVDKHSLDENNYNNGLLLRDELEYDLNNNNIEKTLLNLLCVTKENNEYYFKTTEQLLQTLLGFVFAAADSTGSNLTCTLYSLATNPRCEQEIVKELTEIGLFDFKPNTPINERPKVENFFEFMELPYLDAFVDEILRIYFKATIVRLVKEDLKYKSYLIPKYHLLVMNTTDIHYNELKYWNDNNNEINEIPNGHIFSLLDGSDLITFKPERFLDKNGNKKKLESPYHFIPFSFGPHQCLGMRLAKAEIKLMLLLFIRDYKINIDFNSVKCFDYGIRRLDYKFNVEKR